MIGTTAIEYDERGCPTSVEFKPVLGVDLDEGLRRQLMEVAGDDGPMRIRTQSELVFAAWANRLSEIELADRERYEVAAELVACEKYDEARVRRCEMRFAFRRIS